MTPIDFITDLFFWIDDPTAAMHFHRIQQIYRVLRQLWV
jgi:excinuclease UvrABC ATPase subunit